MAVAPLLVQMLGGNAVTAVSVLACINTADATALRRLHPALAVAVAAVPWADTDTRVSDTARWRAALPAATALKLAAKAPLPVPLSLYYGRALAELGGVMVLDVSAADNVTDAVIARLPPTLRALNVSWCTHVTPFVSFTHLPALESLDCGSTSAVAAGLAHLPPSLRELHMRDCKVPDTADFSHLRHLRRLLLVMRITFLDHLSRFTVATMPPSLEVFDVSGLLNFQPLSWPCRWSLVHLTHLRELNASRTNIDGDALATLPPSIGVLTLERCNNLSLWASFAHLTRLHTLSLCDTPIGRGTLATLPPSLVSLDLHHNNTLTPATVLPHLPALRVLNVSHTDLGDAAVARLPAGLEELHMVCCRKVTQHASLAHLVALRELQSADTDVSPVTIAACRSRCRGCFAPADGKFAVKGGLKVNLLVSLPDGRLVSSALAIV